MAEVPVLPYEQVRPLIRSGDLLLCSGSSPMSRMIQFATNSIFSHVAFILRMDILSRIMVLESVESIGIRACTLGHYVLDYNGTGKPYPGRLFIARHQGVDFSDTLRLHTFSQAAIDLLGHPYNQQQILGITARIVAAKLGMPPQPVAQDDSFICSEFAKICYDSIGINIPYNNANFIAPADFATCAEVHGLWEIETLAFP